MGIGIIKGMSCKEGISNCCSLHDHSFLILHKACNGSQDLTEPVQQVGGATVTSKKYTNKNCGDNHIHYTSLRLLFE
jgi:hypothetical protein